MRLCRQTSLALLLSSISLCASCATLLGFEEFSEEDGSENSPGDGDGDSCVKESECPEDAQLCVDGVCRQACTGGAYFCTGAVLYQCNDEGDGVVGDGQSEGGLCGGGETELYAMRCEAGRAVTSLCFGDEQCDPGKGKCIDPIDIDATEVTRAAYEDFLNEKPALSDQVKGCQWNLTFEADEECMAQTTVCHEDDSLPCDNHPQVCVDWCDAAAYCSSRGRTLCGALGSGDLVDFDEGYRKAGESEWMNACSAGGQVTRSAGDALPRNAATDCVYSGNKAAGKSTYEVGTHENCAFPGPGYDGIFDLVGNVAEWTNNCEVSGSSGNENTNCRPRGGAFDSTESEFSCAGTTSSNVPRSTTSAAIGIRCCDH